MPTATERSRSEAERGDAGDRPFLSGVILAAGRSSRMGRPKQLLPLEDRALLQHVVDNALASRLDEVVLVLGSHAEEVRAALAIPADRALQVVVNPRANAGQSSSLRCGLRAADDAAQAAAILLGDQPGVSAQLIDRLIGAFVAGEAPVVRPSYRGADEQPVPGHPVLIARRLWPELERLEGDEGARTLLKRHPDWLATICLPGEPPADVDTWQDYQRLRDARSQQ